MTILIRNQWSNVAGLFHKQYSISDRGNVSDLVNLLLLQQKAVSREEGLVDQVMVFDPRKSQREALITKP